MDLFDLGLEDPAELASQTAQEIAKGFASLAPCNLCPLYRLSPNNPGIIMRGSFKAKIAVLTDMPSAADMMVQQALTDLGHSGWQSWVQYLNLSENDVFITHVVQCKTQMDAPKPKKKPGKAPKDQVKEKPAKVRMPDPKDADACFYRKALPILKALPNLEAVLAIGTLPVEMLLCQDYKSKEHEGNFYLSDLLPHVPIFCLEHPRDYAAGGDQKKGRLSMCLDVFAQKYIATGDICKIHQYHAAARAEGREADLNHELV